MVKVGKWIAKQRVLILLIGFLLIIPSIIGMAKTRVNYDLLSYLPEHLETVKGQDILVDEYGMGAFSMVVVEDTDLKDVQKLEEKFEKSRSCQRCSLVRRCSRHQPSGRNDSKGFERIILRGRRYDDVGVIR